MFLVEHEWSGNRLFDDAASGERFWDGGQSSPCAAGLSRPGAGARDVLWYITTLSIQKLVSGRKEAINGYVEAHR